MERSRKDQLYFNSLPSDSPWLLQFLNMFTYITFQKPALTTTMSHLLAFLDGLKLGPIA